MTERERDDPPLHKRRQLVRLPRPAPLPRAQDLKPMPFHPPLPAVVGRPVDPEYPTRLCDRRSRREIKQAQPVAEKHVIL
jgi:hypothetical protein